MRFPLRPVMAITLLALCCPSLGSQAAGPRYALVIGNAAYTNMPRLRNPVNDAQDVAKVLTGLGFTVTPLYNGTRKQMNQAIMAFRESLASDNSSEGFFYFAGHGVQAKGVNYLIPVGADIRSEADLDDEAVSLQRVLGSIEDARNRVNVVILDACRDNPLPAASRSAMRGLAVVSSAPPESVVLFSTAQNQTAADGEGRNSPFAAALVKYLVEPGDITRTIKLVTAEVKKATRSAQTPFQYSSLDFDYRLNTAAEPGGLEPSPAATGDITIAILAPLSGSVPTFGVSTREGALLAIKEWNAKGGVLNRKIVAIVEDSRCMPEPAVKAANKVINQDKVHYIVGEVCSMASILVSEIANAAKVIQITSVSTNTAVTVDLSGNVKPFIFRACFIDTIQGKMGAKFAYGNLGARKAFLMLDPANDYVKGLSEAFEKSFTEMGGAIVGKESYTSEEEDFSAILARVKAAKPDVVYLPDYYNVVNLVTRQAKGKGISVPFMGGDGWESSDLDVKASAGGFYTSHYYSGDWRAEVKDFLKAYGAEYKNDTGKAKIPDALAALAYDATNLLLQGIAEAGRDDTTAVKNALEKISFKGVSGPITFDAWHNPMKGAVVMKISAKGPVFNAFVSY